MKLENYQITVRAKELFHSEITIVVAAPDQATAEAWAEDNASDIYGSHSPKGWSDGWDDFTVDRTETRLSNEPPDYIAEDTEDWQ